MSDSLLQIAIKHQMAGSFKEAEDVYRKVLHINPDLIDAHFNLGNMLQTQGRFDEAVLCYGRVLAADRNHTGTHYNLGILYAEQGKFDAAEACFRRALETAPDYAEALNNLGNVLKEQGKLDEAIASYRRALKINPCYAFAYNGAGGALQEQGQLEEAEECYRRALQMNPDYTIAHSNLLLTLNYQPRHDALTIFTEHKRFAEKHAYHLLAAIPPHANDTNPARRLRIGYVSPDFRRHSVGFFIAPILFEHDQVQFEVFCYSDVLVHDEMTKRMQGYAGHWRNISGLSDEQTACMIRNDGIDILIDLAGHTGYNRILLFAHKPAPILVTWIGYPNTTGLPTMDYRIVDALTDPPGMTDPFCTEELIRLPDTFLCYQPDRDSPDVQNAPAIESGHITFGSFNKISKITPEVIALWSDILKATPGSKLLIKAKGINDKGPRRYIIESFKKEGVAEEQLILMSREPSITGHLGVYNKVDIALDTFPYNGTTTTCEAMWMGVPVITLEGNKHVSRVGVSLLSSAGISGLISKTPDEYVKIAVALAKDVDRLKSLRNGLRERMKSSPITDSVRFTRNLETCYRRMWKKWCKNSSAETSGVQAMLQAGIKQHQTGQLAQAETFYRNVLEIQPDQPDALHLLGVLAQQKGDYITAEKMIRLAIAQDSSTPLFYLNLGNALRGQGKNPEAIASYQKAIDLEPKFAVAHYNIANEFSSNKNITQALVHYRKAVELEPDFPEAYLALAKTLHRQGSLDEAIECYQRTITLDPECAEAHFNTGFAKQTQGKLDEAIESYSRAIAIDPQRAEAYNNIGLAQSQQGRLDEAIENYIRALRINPRSADAYYNIGLALMLQGKLEKSLEYYQHVLEIDPEHELALNNLGSVLKEQGKLDEAETCYRRALKAHPDSIMSYTNLLLILNYNPRYDATTIFMEHLQFGTSIAKNIPVNLSLHTNERDPYRRIKIGYVSPDFRKHSVGFFIEPVLASHSHDLFEIFCYANLPVQDEMTVRMQAHTDQWKNIFPMSDDQVTDLIRKDGIDILIDLAGPTGHNRIMIFAYKPAPVQVSWIGYPNTTGLQTMDYRIVDAFTDPPGMNDRFCTEKLIRLPESFLCYLPDSNCPDICRPPVLESGVITFGSFNYFAKLNRDVVALWSKILNAVPNSRLIIKAKSLHEITTRKYASDMFSENGIGMDRVELMAYHPSITGHMAMYGLIDIALDTFPYNGTTTTCEAMWMGVPVVTLEGTTHVSRVGTSLLLNTGIKELIAKSPEEYIEIAVKLANDTERLKSLRQELRSMMLHSPLTDAKRFTLNLENCYRNIWQKWCASTPQQLSPD